MPTPHERSAYWDDRILAWEASRYDGAWRPGLGPGEWLAGLCPGPTRLRQSLAVELLSPFLAGREVLELGCGTGRLASRLLKAGALGYTGLDHSPAAIAQARRSVQCPADRIRFEVGSAERPCRGAGLVVSLGLLDWLTDEELARLFEGQGSADFLHSFSERRSTLKQVLHRACRAADRFVRPAAVRPRYMSAGFLAGLAPAGREGRLYIYRDPRLRFSAFLSSLPLRGARRLREAP